jgi:hypothetical protein
MVSVGRGKTHPEVCFCLLHSDVFWVWNNKSGWLLNYGRTIITGVTGTLPVWNPAPVGITSAKGVSQKLLGTHTWQESTIRNRQLKTQLPCDRAIHF